MHREDAAFLRLVVDQLPFGTVILDRSCKVRLWSQATERLFGWKSSEVLSASLPNIPRDREGERRAFEELVLSGKSLHVNTVRQNKEGSLLEVELTIMPLRDEQDNVTGILGMYGPLGDRFAAINGFLPAKRSETGGTDAFNTLTKREGEIVASLIKGHSTKRIAHDLGITDQVVRNHLHVIYRQLHVPNRDKLVALFHS